MTRNQRIIQMYCSGTPVRDVAARFNMAPNSIRHILRVYGVEIRDDRKHWTVSVEKSAQARDRNFKPHKDEVRCVCLDAYGSTPASEVARKTGLTRNAVIGIWNRAKRRGLLANGAS